MDSARRHLGSDLSGERSDGVFGTGRTLLVVFDDRPVDRGVQLALALVERPRGELTLLRPVVVAASTPLELPDDATGEHEAVAASALDLIAESDTSANITASVRVGHRFDRIVQEAVEAYDIDVVVADIPIRPDDAAHVPTSERLARAVDCSLVASNGIGSFATVDSILVPIAGGPHWELMVDTAYALSAATGASIDFLHVVSVDASADERRAATNLVMETSDRFAAYDRIETWVEEAADVVEAIVDATRYYDVTVIGAPRQRRLKRFVYGSTSETVQSEADAPVVTVWHRRDERAIPRFAAERNGERGDERRESSAATRFAERS